MKRLFTFLAFATLMVAAHAQNAGDYVYTDNGKFKITTGVNLLSNGNFANGKEGWTTDHGTELAPDTFNVANEDGLNTLTVYAKENGYGTGSSLFRKVPVEIGRTYIITYQVRGNDDNVSTAVAHNANNDQKNYQNFLFSTSGELFDEENVSLGKVQNYNFDWETITYSYTTPDNGYILLHFYAPYIGTSFANFAIKEAIRVVDDREAEEVIALLQSYIDNPLFPNQHEILEDAIATFRMCVENDDLDTFTELLNYLDDAINDFLDQNSCDIRAYVPDFTLDNLKTTSANQTSAGAWKIDDQLREENATAKTRWAVKSISDTGAPFEGNYLQDDYPYGYWLRRATVHQTVENMPAATYMFSLKVRGYSFKSKTTTTSETLEGLKVFINNDSTECSPVDIEKATKFSTFSTLDEVGSMELGFFLPDHVASHVDVDFTDFRIVGWTQMQVDEYFLGKEMAEARENLRLAIESAQEYMSNEDYLYGKVRLDSVIVVSQTCLAEITDIDSLNSCRTILNTEIKRMTGRNGALLGLRSAISNAETTLEDDSFAEADKQSLQAAIDTAKAYLATLTVENHEEEGYTDIDISAQTNILNLAINTLLSSILKGDEKYEFFLWAQADDATFEHAIKYDTDDDALKTSGGGTVFLETASYAGHDLNNRFAFRNGNMNVTMSQTNGLEVNFTSKNQVTMALLDLKEGDQIDIDWNMGNASHNVMIVSANAKAKLEDGGWQEYTKTGKDNANVLPKSNANGLSGSVRSTIVMTKDGTLDFYQGSSNSTLRIYYIGITKAPEAKKGDVNNDDVVDINDVVAIINHMAGTTTYKNANVNGDVNEYDEPIVDINDVVAVINIMAGNTSE